MKRMPEGAEGATALAMMRWGWQLRVRNVRSMADLCVRESGERIVSEREKKKGNKKGSPFLCGEIKTRKVGEKIKTPHWPIDFGAKLRTRGTRMIKRTAKVKKCLVMNITSTSKEL